MPDGKRRLQLAAKLDLVFTEDFSERILPFDSHAAAEFANIAVRRRQAGRPISQADAQIAAIAKIHGAWLATRNVTDFENCGLRILNPWIAA